MGGVTFGFRDEQACEERALISLPRHRYFLQPISNCSLDGTPTWSERRGMNPSFGVGAVAEVGSDADSSSEGEEPEEQEEVENYASPAWSNENHICDGTSFVLSHSFLPSGAR